MVTRLLFHPSYWNQHIAKTASQSLQNLNLNICQWFHGMLKSMVEVSQMIRLFMISKDIQWSHDIVENDPAWQLTRYHSIQVVPSITWAVLSQYMGPKLCHHYWSAAYTIVKWEDWTFVFTANTRHNDVSIMSKQCATSWCYNDITICVHWVNMYIGYPPCQRHCFHSAGNCC